MEYTTNPHRNLQPATQVGPPPTTNKALPTRSAARASSADTVTAPKGKSEPRSVRVVRALWRGRSLIGGLLAVGIGWIGENSLLTSNDYVTSTRNYIIAIALLIISFAHPAFALWSRRKSMRTEAQNQPAETKAASNLPIESTLPVRQARNSQDDRIAAANGSHNAHQTDLPATTPSGNGHKAYVDNPDETRAAQPAREGRLARLERRWQQYVKLRVRLGWKMTATGLALTLLLAGVSAFVLNGNTGSPLGGWLWAAALFVLTLTFLAAPGWPRSEGLLPAPRSDFFGPGVPVIPRRVEAALVVLLMGLAVFLRTWNLEYHPGIFGDEGERGLDALAIYNGQPDNLFGTGWWFVPNIYFYIISLSFRIFGPNLIGDRMVSVVSGLVAVWFVYKTARLLWGPRAGLLAGAMLAVSPLALQFSRQAGESSPTGALWAVGAYYFFLALRYRKWSDWMLAGFAWSFSLYFYASGKLSFVLAAGVALYCLVRWRLEFFKRYFLGFALMGFAFLLMFMPYGIFSAKNNWLPIVSRANETSIFSPQNQAGIFQRYNLTYNPTWAARSTFDNLKTNPVAWGVLLYQQTRETFDMLYRRGDQVFYYRDPDWHGGSALEPLWAVLGLLGLAYAAWKLWDARYGLSLLWFAVGFAASIATIDTPNFQRITGAWPVMMFFPAMLVDRIFAGGWPLSVSLARKWATIPIIALMLYIGATSYYEYFVQYPTTCPYCRDTVQARFAQSLGQDYKAYQMGVGGWDVYFGYGSTRFVARDIEGVDMLSAADELPILDNNGKGAAFIIYPNNSDYLPIVRLFYPQGVQAQQAGQDGVTQFTTYKISLQQLEATRTLYATYTPQGGPPINRQEPNLGTATTSLSNWTAPAGLTFPATAQWQGGLVAPSFGAYTFSLSASEPGAKLDLDGSTILQAGGPPTVQMVLAKGLHDIKLSGTLASATSRLSVAWAPGNGQAVPVEPLYLFNGPTGGLSGQVGSLAGAPGDLIKQPDPFSARPPTSRRSDPFIGFRVGTPAFGREPQLIRWQGKLNAPVDGNYNFTLNTSGTGLVLIDGRTVVGNGPDGLGPGSLQLAAGLHDIDVRVATQGEPARMELMWTPPGSSTQFIPPSALVPVARSWPRGAIPNAQPATLPESLSTHETIQPDTVFGSSDLSRPRGLAIDKEGNIYVGDRGNYRIVVYSPDGKLLRTWGKQATPQQGLAPGQEQTTAPNWQPGEFAEIKDVAVAQDSSGGQQVVYVLDSTTRVQVFTTAGQFITSYEPTQLALYGPNGLAAGAPISNTQTTGSQGSKKPRAGAYIAVTGQNRILALPALANNANSQPQGQGQGVVGSQSITVSGADGLDQPIDVAADPTGSGLLYIIDMKDRIAQLKPVGQIWQISAQWRVPVGRDDGGGRLAISSDGKKVYMSDPDRKRIAVLDIESGQISYFGQEGQGPGQFEGPSGIAVDPNGRVVVLDRNNNVQLFSVGKK